jgi:imidazolonepropionase-like amidohydrolase
MTPGFTTLKIGLFFGLSAFLPCAASAQIAVKGRVVHTLAGEPIENGVVVVREGKITAVGKSSEVLIPEGFRVLEAAVVTPGLIDAHSVVGLSGIYNQSHDQDQLDHTSAMQPELRGLDAYNAREELVAWIRSFGVTTVHTGPAPGALISGQTVIVKTSGRGVDVDAVVESAMIACTIGDQARGADGKTPGTRSKVIALLRAELLKAGEYRRKQEKARDGSGGDPDEENAEKKAPEPPPRDLGLEPLVRVLDKEMPLLVTVHRAHDILSALRVAEEFDINLVLDGVAEAHLVLDRIKASGFPVILHPPMARTRGVLENSSFETAARLAESDIPFAFQSGFEGYVPKTRVVLFEAALAAANGLAFDRALSGITLSAARILGIEDRVGSLEPGKDGDLALFDGDPFEYTTHCTGVVIEGVVVSQTPR